jgi:hypothetical protein
MAQPLTSRWAPDSDFQPFRPGQTWGFGVYDRRWCSCVAHSHPNSGLRHGWVATRTQDAMRVHFIELHEQPLFPSTIRDEVMDAMQFGCGLLRLYQPVVPILRKLLNSTHSRCVVDLYSGGGGPWFELAGKLEGEGGKGGLIDVLLTDKFPNLDTSQRLESLSKKTPTNLAFNPHPVDALHIPETLKGLRTIFSSFHHFPPGDARAILRRTRLMLGKAFAYSKCPSAIR